MITSDADRRASIRRRAALAVLLTVGFYALAFGVVGILLTLLLLDIGSGHFHIALVIPAVAGIYAILTGIVPRHEEFEAPSSRITAAEHPRLFEKLEEVASKAGQPMPDEVYVLPELNAWVADVGGAQSHLRRVMAIGFPLLHVLDVPQLCAVIAHEFGHYYGGDTQLGPWIYRTRKTIGETLSRLSRSHVGSVRALVHAPFAAYGKMFLRVTQSVSRQQEYTADRFAAAIVSPQALVGALKRLDGYQPGVDRFWYGLLMPVLAMGHRPSVAEGMRRLVESEHVAELATQHTEDTLKNVEEDLYLDTHPSLHNRVAALDALPPVEVESAPPAISLLDDVPAVEDKILRMYMPEDAIGGMEEIEWDDVAATIIIPRWTARRDHNRAVLGHWTVDQLPEVLMQGQTVAARLVDLEGNAAPPERHAGLMLTVVRACLGLALREAGWTFFADPEHGMIFERGEARIDLEVFIQGIASGQIAIEPGHPNSLSNDWARICEKAGISGRLLGGAGPPTAAPAPPTDG